MKHFSYHLALYLAICFTVCFSLEMEGSSNDDLKNSAGLAKLNKANAIISAPPILFEERKPDSKSTIESCSFNILHVDQSVSTSGDGNSWATAMQSLADAILLAHDCPNIHTIRVAQGTYYPEHIAGDGSEDRDKAFTFTRDGLTVLGGYASGGSNERDHTAYPTILSGDIGIPEDDSDNVYHVILTVGPEDKPITGSLVFDGFTISQGNANDGPSITMEGLPVWKSNGGGMYNIRSSPEIRNCIYLNNASIFRGGGVHNALGTPIFNNCSFIGNSAEAGGGILNWNSNTTITTCNFSNNQAMFGGGVYNFSSSTVISQCIFSENSVSAWGGGVYNENCNPLISNCSFLENHAGFFGGGLHNIGDSSPLITNCNFSGNTAGEYGGGMSNNFDSSPTIHNSLFSGNTAQYFGGGMVNFNSSSPQISNCTFSGNSAVYNGGGMINSSNSNPVITNCIIYGNSTGVYNVNTSPIITHSLVQNISSTENGNLDGDNTDPLFIDAPTYLTAPFTLGDYQLQSGSPCIDAGDNSVNLEPIDLAGNDRVAGGLIDMGAYEFQEDIQSPCSTVYVNSIASGNNDGSSWEDAFSDLQDALEIACTCEGVSEIWVAQGVYYPSIPAGREATFQLCNGVAIYGGFAGWETNLEDRNWVTNITTLSGDLDGNDSPGILPDNLIEHPSRAENTYSVVTGSGTDPSAILDGFIVTGGNANDDIDYILIFGGGIVNIGGSPSIMNCRFIKNSAQIGGATYNENGSSLFSNCTFWENSGGVGGGILNWAANTTFSYCDISLNVATSSDGGGMLNVDCTSIIISNCSFTSNSASYFGGAINNWNSQLMITNSVFSGNSAVSWGGAIMNQAQSSGSLINCTLLGNRAAGGGGMLNWSESSPEIINCTFSGNAADIGGSMYNIDSHPEITNSIFYGNSSGIENDVSSPVITYSLIEGIFPSGDGNLDGTDPSNDPLFVNPPSHLNAPSTEGDLRLSQCSPAINTGNNIINTEDFDLAGNERIMLGIIDLGAYESAILDSELPTVTCPEMQTLFLDAICTSVLPDYSALLDADDNCGISDFIQTPTAGTFIEGAGNLLVTFTVTDINNNTNFCTFTVEKIDNTPPSISCPENQILTLDENCSVTLPDYTGFALIDDNCGASDIAQTPAPGTIVSNAGSLDITITVTDINSNTNTCTFTVEKIDNTPPLISCPENQTLNLDFNCTALLPDYTDIAISSDNCSILGLTQSPEEGFSFHETGNQTISLVVHDINENTNSCTFSVEIIDPILPTVSCPEEQTLFLGSDCGATLPDYLALASVGDNCGVMDIMQSPLPGSILSGSGILLVEFTVTDINGNINECNFTVEKVDITLPLITCPDLQTLTLGTSNCTAMLPDYTGLALSSDNCNVAGISQVPAAGSIVSEVGSQIIMLTVTDINNLSQTCTFIVDKVDEIPPTAICSNNTVYLDVDGNYIVTDNDVLDFNLSYDNCGDIEVISVLPEVVNCEDLGLWIPVQVLVTDESGNSSTCVANIYVEEGDQLPNGWTNAQIGGNAGNTSFSICNTVEDGVFELNSTGFSFGTSDTQQFASQTLCGYGSIIAEVVSLNGGGWAGIQYRETQAAGSKKAVLKTQMHNFVRREIRVQTNGMVQSQQLFAPNRRWLRIDRIGNSFTGYHSTNGVNWTFSFATNIFMNSCIDVGLIVESINNSAVTSGVFQNVEILSFQQSSLSTTELSNNSFADIIDEELNIFPNPTEGEINIQLDVYLNKNVLVEVYNMLGQCVALQNSDGQNQLRMNIGSTPGLYMVNVKKDGIVLGQGKIVVY